MRLRTAVLCGFVAVFPLIAFAQAQRTFVSATGLDTNPCSRQQPCRNFAAAVAATASGGEVIVLDSAGYGPATLTQSVSLIAPAGVYAGITAFSGSAIQINAAGATIVLRGLTVNGEGGSTGIDATNLTALFIDRCVVGRFSGDGVSDTSAGSVFVDDLTSHDNGGDGLVVFPSAGIAEGEIDRSHFDSDNYGVVVAGVNAAGTNMSIRDSVATNNVFAGIGVTSATLSVKSCASSWNRWGVNAATATVFVSNSAITNNTDYGLLNNGGTVSSFQNNAIHGNGTDKSATVGTILFQ